MNITREQVLLLANLDDSKIKALVYEAAIASGANELTARLFSSNVRMIKNRLKNATDDEINTIIAAIGESRARAIIEEAEKSK